MNRKLNFGTAGSSIILASILIVLVFYTSIKNKRKQAIKASAGEDIAPVLDEVVIVK